MLTRIEEASGYCGKCLAQVPIWRKKVRHWIHLILTVLTGLWAVVWILEIRKAHPWRCRRCGEVVYKVMKPVNGESLEQ